MELWSAIGPRFTTTGSTLNFMRTRDGVSVSDDFQIRAKDDWLAEINRISWTGS